jgi:hypothetical protein
MTTPDADTLYRIRTLATTLFLEAGVAGRDLDYAEAKKLAAKQIALEEKKKKPAPPPSHAGGKGDVGTLLFQRIADMAANMRRSGRRPGPDDSLMARYIGRIVFGKEPQPEQSTATVPEQSTATVKTRIKATVRKLADKVGVEQPEPKVKQRQQRASTDKLATNFPLLYADGGLHSAKLISNSEFPATLTGSVTDNWRRSVEWNEQQRKRMGR